MKGEGMRYLILASVIVAIIATACNLQPSDPTISSKRQQVENTLQNIAISFEQDKNYTASEIYDILEKHLNDNHDIFGAAWASAPDNAMKVNVYYIYRDGNTYVTRSEEKVTILSGTLEWYSLPLKTKKLEWSKPYKVKSHSDDTLTLITCSMPIKKSNGDLEAIIACDYLIDQK